ncbi:5-dehydro-4-deoxy-D-glucuronate isomerase [Spirosoma arcticum]
MISSAQPTAANGQVNPSLSEAEQRYASSPLALPLANTAQLRDEFLIETIFQPGQVTATYSHYDRMFLGGVMPTQQSLDLLNYGELKANFFLQRREIGIINVGGSGTVTAGGVAYDLAKLDCLYVGQGCETVSFGSSDLNQPAQFYWLSTPAHRSCPTRLMTSAEATPVDMGSPETVNQRTIYKYIHNDGVESCQLVMGLTVLKPGSVWNTMPAHTHDRRSEAYLYFDLPTDQRVVHLMGQPTETRHLIVADRQAIISPPWSIHSGCGTSNYSFIWGMAGENKEFTDMDAVPISALR